MMKVAIFDTHKFDREALEMANKGLHDLVSRFEEISGLTKIVKEELYRLLVAEFKYFE